MRGQEADRYNELGRMAACAGRDDALTTTTLALQDAAAAASRPIGTGINNRQP
jgi:hypothetical protein